MEFKVKCVKSLNKNEFIVGKTYDWVDGMLADEQGNIYKYFCEGTDVSKWRFTSFQFERVGDNEPDKKYEIHITADGSKTIAVLKEDGKIVKRAEAKCNPEDKFNFEYGAELALKRLYGKQTFAENFRQAWKAIQQKAAKEAKPEPKFKVGDKVKILDNSKSYTTFLAWFKENAPELIERYSYGNIPNNDNCYKVVKVVDKMVSIEGKTKNDYDVIFLMREDGLEKA